MRIQLPELPGILALFTVNSATAAALGGLAEALLVAPSTLTRAEREIIAAFVSSLNECDFCFNSHAAAAIALLDEKPDFTKAIRQGDTYPFDNKLRTLLHVARNVANNKTGSLTDHECDVARLHGATDKEIHDTVLIAAAFCLFNKYVDSLSGPQSNNIDDYLGMGKMLAENGYVQKP